MNILKSIVIGLVVAISFTGSLLFVAWLEKPGSELKGEIYIETSSGKRVKFNRVPVFLIKKSVAAEIELRSINKLSSINKNLALTEPAAFTDAEGKFELTGANEESAIAVLATKYIDGENAAFFWLIPVDIEQRLPIMSLNNNNLTEDFVSEELNETD